MHLRFFIPILAVAALGASSAPAPLIETVKQGDLVAIRALLQQKVDVNAPAVDGTTALHWAAYRDDLATVELLLRAGADARAANRYGVTALSLAAENGSAPIIERLVAAGADATCALPGGETV